MIVAVAYDQSIKHDRNLCMETKDGVGEKGLVFRQKTDRSFLEHKDRDNPKFVTCNMLW